MAVLTRDSTAQHRLEERLRDSEERLRILVGQVVDYAIIMLDPVGTVDSWNAGAERLQGYTEEEAMGDHFSVFHTEPEDRRAGLPQRLLGDALRDGRRGAHGVAAAAERVDASGPT